MINAFSLKKQQILQQDDHDLAKQKQKILRKQAVTQNMAQNSQSRRQEWLSKIQQEDDDTFQQHYLFGTQQFDDKPYKFRDEDPSKFFGRRNVIPYSQKTSKERANVAAEQYKANFLGNNKYTDKDPVRNPTDGWLKDRHKSGERSTNFIHNVNNEIDRTKTIMKSQSLKSFEPMNTKMLYDTPLRENDKDKHLSSQPFISTSGPKDKAWQPTPIRQTQEYEPFSAKFVSIEDFSRKRNTLKEVGRNEFDAFSRQDSIWSQKINSSNSIRTYQSLQGYIKTLTGKLETDSISARDSLSSMQQQRIQHSKTQHFLKKIKSQYSESNSNQGSTMDILSGSQTQKVHSAIPTSFSIQDGDFSKVSEILNVKKELPQKASLFYVPDVQLQSTQNQKFKVPVTITDKYLMDKIQSAKRKSYYKSAEMGLNKLSTIQTKMYNINSSNSLTSQNLAVQFGGNIDNSGIANQNQLLSERALPEVVTNMDIGQLLLNEKMREGSKDNSPLISGRRQISNTSTDDMTSKEQLLLNQQTLSVNSDGQYQKPDISPTLRLIPSHSAKQQKRRTHSIQEESEETDEDSPNKKYFKGGMILNSNLAKKGNNTITNQSSAGQQQRLIIHKQVSHQNSMSNLIQQSSSYIKKINAEKEKQKREFYALSPTIHKDVRTHQLKGMMDNYFQNSKSSFDQSTSSKSLNKKNK
eukprot:403367123